MPASASSPGSHMPRRRRTYLRVAFLIVLVAFAGTRMIQNRLYALNYASMQSATTNRAIALQPLYELQAADPSRRIRLRDFQDLLNNDLPASKRADFHEVAGQSKTTVIWNDPVSLLIIGFDVERGYVTSFSFGVRGVEISRLDRITNHINGFALAAIPWFAPILYAMWRWASSQRSLAAEIMLAAGLTMMTLWLVYPENNSLLPETRPQLFAALATAVFLLVPCAWWWVQRFHRPPDPLLCTQCHYNLTANTTGKCPECGAEVPESQQRRIADTMPRSAGHST